MVTLYRITLILLHILHKTKTKNSKIYTNSILYDSMIVYKKVYDREDLVLQF